MTLGLGFAIIFGVMILIAVVAWVISAGARTKNKKESEKSMPQGTDQSDFAKLLQDKYRAERDSGEFTRQSFD